MELSNSKLYESSTLQANLLYRYLLENLSRDSSEDFQSQLIVTNQKLLYLYPQTLIEVLVFPMSDYLDIVSNPRLLENDDAIYWNKIQLEEIINLSAVTKDTKESHKNCIDVILSELLFGLSKNILKRTKQFKLKQKFVKVLFPVEGMFEICIKEDKIYFSYQVRHLITSKYVALLGLINAR